MVKRLFIGLELPDYCTEALANLDPGVKGVRWLPPEQMHLTMSFLGNVKAREEEQLREALSGVQIGAFFLPIQGVGVFGKPHPKVVWAGVGKGHSHLFALHKRVQDAVLRAGLEPDLRTFHPHITIGRTTSVSRAALLPFLRSHAEEEIGFWKVTGFTLFSSVLSPEGAMHSVEMRQEFQSYR
jgi:2'-5' RNA ligase